MIEYADIVPIRNSSGRLEWISLSKISKVYQKADGRMVIQLVGGCEVLTSLDEWSRIKGEVERRRERC